MYRDQTHAFPSVPAGRRRAVALALMAIAVAFLALAPQARAENRAGVIAVTGSGSIERAPDYAQIHVTVTTAAPQVPEAVDANNVRTQEVLARLEAIGVAREDIRTASSPGLCDTGKQTHGRCATPRAGLHRGSPPAHREPRHRRDRSSGRRYPGTGSADLPVDQLPSRFLGRGGGRGPAPGGSQMRAGRPKSSPMQQASASAPCA